jgi:quercetin dioxygenase-like cupin family protein
MTNEPVFPATVRRILTGHDAEGRAVVRSDKTLPPAERNEALVRFFKLWATDRAPADLNDEADGALLPTGLASNGTVLRVVDLGPGMRSPMHRTQSLDYGVVLEGKVDLELDDGSVTHLKVGDIVVQRGTIHAWANPSQAWSRMAFVLVAADPACVNGKPLPPTDA